MEKYKPKLQEQLEMDMAYTGRHRVVSRMATRRKTSRIKQAGFVLASIAIGLCLIILRIVPA
jgi:hypothetical protein